MIRVAIVGHGIEGWLCAAKLATCVNRQAIDITVVPAAGAADWDSLYCVHPLEPADTIRAVGISDLDLVQQCDASFGLGSTWANGNLLPYGATGTSIGGVAFHHHWRLHIASTTAQEFFRFSPGARALQRHAFAPPVPRNAIGSLQHEIARHVDPSALRERLRRTARHHGVCELAESLSDRQDPVNAGPVEMLRLTNDQAVRADLYIDASGPARVLCSRSEIGNADTTVDQSFEFSGRRIKSGSARLPAFSVRKASSQWRIDVPLGSGDMQLRFDGAADTGTFQTGYSRTPWCHNVVAIGHAAARFLPLAPLPVRLLNHTLTRLVRLLPGNAGERGEALEFNQRFAHDASEVSDLTVWLRDGTTTAGSDALVARHQLFSRRGWIRPTDATVITDDDWINAFMGRGLLPQHVDPMTRRVGASEARQILSQLDDEIERVVSEFPTLDRYLQAAKAAGSTAHAGAAT